MSEARCGQTFALHERLCDTLPMAKRFPKNTGPTQRQLRAGELIRHALVDILRQEDFQDPDLKNVSVTVSEVRPSPDLKHATVFVAPLGGGDASETADALNRASRFLRGRLGRTVELKFTPQLHFIADTSFDTASAMDALLANPKIAQDIQRDGRAVSRGSEADED